MSKFLDKLRKRAAAKAAKSSGRNPAEFAHWKATPGTDISLRFTPNGDPELDFFVEKQTFRLSFIDPNDDTKELHATIPCMEMYEGWDVHDGKRCPILEYVRELYGEERELKNGGNSTEAKRYKDIAGRHWVMKTYYMQGFVRDIVGGTVVDDSVPENPIRIFNFSKKLFNNMYSKVSVGTQFNQQPFGEFYTDQLEAWAAGDDNALLDEDGNSSVMGTDYIVNRIKKGEYMNYDDSAWARNDTPFTEEELAAICEYGYHDLEALRPAEPTAEMIDVYKDMMEISLARSFGLDDGYWKAEWTEAGVKPYSPDGKSDEKKADADADAKAEAEPAETKPAETKPARVSKKRASKKKAAKRDTPEHTGISATERSKSVRDMLAKRGAASAKSA